MILGNTVSHKQNRRFPGEVISDPLSDTEEEGRTDPQKPHQVQITLLFQAINFKGKMTCCRTSAALLAMC